MHAAAASMPSGQAEDGIDATRANFEATLPRVQKALQECSFFAIDCEMTGKEACTLMMPRGTHGLPMHAVLSQPAAVHACVLAGLFVDGNSQESFLDDMGDRCAERGEGLRQRRGWPDEEEGVEAGREGREAGRLRPPGPGRRLDRV